MLQGSTAHFKVYYDPPLGADGVTIANGVLAACEADYSKIKSYFGGITPPNLPFNVIIANLQGGGAYHYGCSATDIYCDVKTTPTVDPTFTEFLNMAEVVEVFEAGQAKGWDCGASNGEGLSRVLATALYPAELNGFATAHDWLDSARPDIVNSTDPTDTNPISNGCSVLFLNYLHSQLGFTRQAITKAAGSTLAQTYAGVTGKSDDPFPAFKALLDAKFPPGNPSGLQTDNPWPITLKAPVITSPKNASGQVGKSFAYTIRATNNPTSFGATGLPGGLTVNTSNGVISGTPTVSGSFQIMVSATNTLGTGTANVNITVKPPISPSGSSHTGSSHTSSGSGTGGSGTSIPPQSMWMPPPSYAVPPVPPVPPPPPPPLAEVGQRLVGTLMRSPALGIVAVVGLVTVGVVGVVALSDGSIKTTTDQ